MKKYGALLLIGAITMVLVACSSDEEATPTVVPTSQPEPTQAPVKPIQLRQPSSTLLLKMDGSARW